MPEWQITFPDERYTNYNAECLEITDAGVLKFIDYDRDGQPWVALAYSAGVWLKVERVDPVE